MTNGRSLSHTTRGAIIAQYNFIGSGEGTKQHVQEALFTEWEHMPQELIDRLCMNFHVNLLQVQACRGDNMFNG